MQIRYTHDELLSEHPFEGRLVVDGVTFHGGFINGQYMSPRTLHRMPAIKAWQERLPSGALDAILEPMTSRIPPQFPNVEQTRLLVRHGVMLPLVHILSLIAIVEGFGGEELPLVPIPNFDKRLREPIDGTALAHLKSLFDAHARDEEGHRMMWEFARDIALDHPEIPKNLATSFPPPSARRLVPEIPADMEAIITRLLTVLSVEVFAVESFRWARAVLGDASLFARHADAEQIIAYVQQDETPHVGYLATALAEVRSRTFVGEDGAFRPALPVIDRMLSVVMLFQTGLRYRANCAARMQVVERALAEHPRREEILAEFGTLGPMPLAA